MRKYIKNILYKLCTLTLAAACLYGVKMDAQAVAFPNITLTFDPADESVIVEGMPGSSADGKVEYRLEGYMNYDDERVETFCYGPSAKPYDVPEKMAYIFNWADAEFLLPCSGEYTFTAYVTACYGSPQGPVEEKGPKTTITITLHKKDESTNWGPGLPNTTVETYDLKQIQGKNKSIKIEEPEYTWTIHGMDIVNIPEVRNLSLKVTADPATFADTGVEKFFGDTLVLKLNVEHSGEFGFTAVLDYKMGTQYIGKYANLFYVTGDGSFEYMCGALVDENGVASFPFTHASDYIVAVTDVEYTGQELNPEPTFVPATTCEPTPEPTVAPELLATPEPIPESAAAPKTTTVPQHGEISSAYPDEDSVVSNEQSTSAVITTRSRIDIWAVLGIGVMALVLTFIFVRRKK